MAKRSYSKEIRQHNIAHAIKCFKGLGGKKELIRLIKDNMKAYGLYVSDAVYKMAKEGEFIPYTDDRREYIRRLLDETTEEADKYSDEQVDNLYCSMMARDIPHMPELKND